MNSIAFDIWISFSTKECKLTGVGNVNLTEFNSIQNMTLYRYTKNIERMEVNLVIDFKDFF